MHKSAQYSIYIIYTYQFMKNEKDHFGEGSD